MAVRVANSSNLLISNRYNANPSLYLRFFCWNEFLECWPGSQIRSMSSSKRVQDRSHLRRVRDLEIAKAKWKVTKKILFLMETLRQEPEMIMQVRKLSEFRRQISLPKPHKISDFLRKSPKLFELYRDQKGVLWCGMTERAEELVKEEEKIIEERADKVAEYVTRFLMMSVDKRLRIDQIGHFRRDFGLPIDFREKWVNNYPELFKLVKSADDVEYLELVSWNPAWAVTELEKRVLGVTESAAATHTPGWLSLEFPLKFPPSLKRINKAKIHRFQKTSYLSPYAHPGERKPGTPEANKRAVAIMHELLNFTIEKRLVTDHLTHFKQELYMPQKLMRLFLRHFGIFYVSERGKRFSVFLTEAYEGSELINKCPLVLWREKVLSLAGYRGKKKKIPTFEDMSEVEYDSSVENGSDSDMAELEHFGSGEDDSESEQDIGCFEANAVDANTNDKETVDALSE